ncbi:MAG: GAF domain-containing protein [Gammaproteobacteria bacterium]|nr:GAF domain-containing protein [Gammaproteobacteria bacterium]
MPQEIPDDSAPLTVDLIGGYLGCSQREIDAALAQQLAEGTGEHKRLGEILVENGLLDRGEMLEGIHNQRLARLKPCLLFADLSKKNLKVLSRSFEEVTVEADQVFINQDSRDRYLYILATGQLQVYRADESGQEISIVDVYPGEPIGEMAYFSDGYRSASIRAIETSQLVRIHYAELTRCLDKFPDLAKAFLKLVTGRLRNTNLAFEDSVHRRMIAERSLKHLNEFLDLSDVLALRLGIEGLIERVVHTASRLMNADRASLFLIDPVTGELWSKVAEGDEVREIRIPAGAGIAGWVAEHHETINIEDAYEDPRFNQEVDKRTGYRTRTILCGPVYNLKSEVSGVVQVINKKSGVFNQEDETLFRAVAHQAAISIENYFLYRRVIGSNEKMALLLDISTSLSQTLDMGQLIHNIVTRIPELLQCDRSALFMLDDSTRELWSMEMHGQDVKEIRFPANIGIAGFTATTGEIVNIPDAYNDPRFNPEVDRKTGYRTRTILCIPLTNRDSQTIGVVQAVNKQAGPFADDDVKLLRAVSSQISVALVNAQLHMRTVRMKDYLENVQESISNAILSIDTDFHLVTANRAAVDLFGASADGFIGCDLRESIGVQNPFLMKLIQRAYLDRESVARYDVELSLPEGTKTVNINLVPLPDIGDEEQGLVVALEDITREKRVHGTLTRYMPKDIVDRVLEDAKYQVLGGVQSEATILFNDIRGFTPLSEGLGAEGTMDFLNEYFSMMVEEIFRYKGLLDKYIGDALMAVFGLPYRQDDDPVRAVHAALRMKKRLADFNHQRIERGLPPVRTGIGVNTGEVISGNMGSEMRMDYTVIGDAVNIASRLESLNKQYGTEILISENTRNRLEDGFFLLEIDQVRLKGKSKPTRIYEVMGEKGYAPAEPLLGYIRGLTAYRQRDYKAASACFQPGAAQDTRCQIYMSRCEALIKQPPPDDWDGVWNAEFK